MADEPLEPTETSIYTAADGADEVTLEDEDAQKQPKKSLWGLLGIVTLVVIAILVLLLLRDCGGANDRLGQGSSKTIEAVEGLKPVAGQISVWVKDGTRIHDVLIAARVKPSEVLPMGGGRYVITVQSGLEADTLDAIAGQEGVYDAGLVYARRTADH